MGLYAIGRPKSGQASQGGGGVLWDATAARSSGALSMGLRVWTSGGRLLELTGSEGADRARE